MTVRWQPRDCLDQETGGPSAETGYRHGLYQRVFRNRPIRFSPTLMLRVVTRRYASRLPPLHPYRRWTF